METKICNKCNQEKEIGKFRIRYERATKRRRNICTSCEYERKEELKEEKQESRSRKRKRNLEKYTKEYLKQKAKDRHNKVLSYKYQYLMQHPCVDCGEADPLVLEFDHRDPTDKTQDISECTSLRSLIAEILKCDVRCCNCHRKRTAKQFNWSILALVRQF